MTQQGFLACWELWATLPSDFSITHPSRGANNPSSNEPQTPSQSPIPRCQENDSSKTGNCMANSGSADLAPSLGHLASRGTHHHLARLHTRRGATRTLSAFEAAIV